MSIMETIPIWDDPHTFTRVTDNGDETVFSYGLLLPELPILGSSEGQAKLSTRWGETPELGPGFHVEDGIQALHEQLAPDISKTRLVKERMPDLGAGMTIRDTSVLSKLIEFGRALQRAADGRSIVPDGSGDELRSFLDLVERPDRFVWRWRIVGDVRVRVRAARCDNLLQRLAVEYDHLVTRQPRLARCKLCGRVFVPLRPSRPEMHCRSNLWRPGRPPVLLERCVPLDETERRRTEKRLHQRYRRALESHGARSAKTKAALRAWSTWKRANPPTRERGRQPRPEATNQPEGQNDA